MQSFAIVKHFNVTEHELFGFLACGRNAVTEVIETLGFERGLKAFHNGIIITVCLATHALNNRVVPQKVTEQFAGMTQRVPRCRDPSGEAGQRHWHRQKRAVPRAAPKAFPYYQPRSTLHTCGNKRPGWPP